VSRERCTTRTSTAFTGSGDRQVARQSADQPTRSLAQVIGVVPRGLVVHGRPPAPTIGVARGKLRPSTAPSPKAAWLAWLSAQRPTLRPQRAAGYVGALDLRRAPGCGSRRERRDIDSSCSCLLRAARRWRSMGACVAERGRGDGAWGTQSTSFALWSNKAMQLTKRTEAGRIPRWSIFI